MDVVILCGGKGTRLSEETTNKPKPMVRIGTMPILWHIMSSYSYYGYKKFILALGYQGASVKEYFYNLRIARSDFTLKLNPRAQPQFLGQVAGQDWEVTFVDTGEHTQKGGRIKRIERHIGSDEFLLTYGDGVSDVDIGRLVQFHRSHQSIGTLTAVNPPSRFGEIVVQNDRVVKFEEKPQMATGLINGGFFVFNRRIMDYLSDAEDCDFEFGALQQMASEGQLRAYRHDGFWQCMDNVRERDYLTRLVNTGNAPWMKWE